MGAPSLAAIIYSNQIVRDPNPSAQGAAFVYGVLGWLGLFASGLVFVVGILSAPSGFGLDTVKRA